MKIKFLYRKFLVLCCFSLALFARPTKVQASHLAAVDMWVDYVGTEPGQLVYRTTLEAIKACEPNNASLFNPNYISISSASCGLSFPNLAVDTTGNNTNDTLDQLCDDPLIKNSCENINSTFPGYIRWRYTRVDTLPVACEDWTFTWSNCCRNGGIDNFCNSSSHSIVVQVILNNVAKINNSSARFTIMPLPYTCVNKLVQYYNGTYSPDNDSLVTANSWPLGCGSSCNAGCGTNGEIPYETGYSFPNPLGSTTPYTVDPFTGVATFTPGIAGEFVLGFSATEYDRNTKGFLSKVIRDAVLNVLPCNTTAPAIDSVPLSLSGGQLITQGGNTIITCPGAAVTFNMSAVSQTPTNQVYLRSNASSIPGGATFTVVGQGTGNPVGTFNWTPNSSHIGNHFFYVEAKDSTCNNNDPLVLTSYLVVQIKVYKGMEGGPDLYNFCSNADKPIQITAEATPTSNYRWTYADGSPIAAGEIDNPNARSPWVKPLVTTAYRVETDSLPNVCKIADTVVVNIDVTNSVTIRPDPAVVCREGYIQLDAVVDGPPPLTNVPCQDNNPYTGTIYTASFGTGSNFSSTFTPFLGGEVRSTRTQLLYRKSDIFNTIMRSGTIYSFGINVQTPTAAEYNNLAIRIGCTEMDEINPVTGFLPGTTQVFASATPIVLAGGWNTFNFDIPYNWDTTKNLLVEICYANGIATDVAPNVLYTGVNYGSMLRTSSTNSAVCTGTSTTSLIGSVARPDTRFTFAYAPDAPFTYKWWPGRQLSDSNVKSPIAYVDRSQRYYVSIIGRNGCPFLDSIDVILPVHDYKINPYDTSICWGEDTKIEMNEAHSIQWYENGALSTTVDCDNCNPTIAKPLSNTVYYAVVTDQWGCKDTLTSTVEVRPLPDVRILNNDTIIKYGSSIELLASGGYLYQWYPAGWLNNPTLPNPIATPKEPVLYTVAAIGTNGCLNKDSVFVDIDYGRNLFVPTAFSPNGDGRNDVFRVFNINFQKLLEFRVFNRYGHEVFNTLSATDGWDGTFKGVQQDIGTYTYLIRVAYPDGKIETYKGDVTLVR